MLKDAGFSSAKILNPKRHADAEGAQQARLFPYYAGYSAVFAGTLFASLQLDPLTRVLDPWNGAGVTTHTARRFGVRALGQDLNPVMVLIAKAEALSLREVGSLGSTVRTILGATRSFRLGTNKDDPLNLWFSPATSRSLRSIETAIRATLTKLPEEVSERSASKFSEVSSIGAFFYVALFLTARSMLGKFRASNPTWTKSPEKPHLRKHATRTAVRTLFLEHCRRLSSLLAAHSFNSHDASYVRIRVGNSESLAAPDSSVDFVLTSPPYCTRIDYAKATEIELSVLGISGENFSALRQSLMGTSSIRSEVLLADARWGKTCNQFLRRMHAHASKASKTYYYKNHLQYFQSLFNSLREIARVLVPSGKCVIVIQDSYYKEVRNDVPKMLVEMAAVHGLALSRKVVFASKRSMADVNKRAKKYIRQRITRECVLCFSKRQ